MITPTFDELVALAVETGREGVKALKAQPVEKTRSSPCPGSESRSRKADGAK